MADIFSLLLRELEQSAVFDPNSRELFEKISQKFSSVHEKNESVRELENNEELLTALSTMRNRNLITADEQKKLQNVVVGCFGLSVGSHAIITWMMESRAKRVKILDPDTISPSNLNRLRFGWSAVGRKKVDVVKESLLEINPFVDSLAFSNSREMTAMFDHPSVDCIVDAIDSIEGKIFLRKIAKEKHIPLISAADVGDNVILDIERYDKQPFPKAFLGRITEEEIENIHKISPTEKKKLIIKLVGFEDNSEQLLSSLIAIGKTLPTWPQLGATATIAGGIVATTIKKIFLGEDVRSGRYAISLDKLLDHSYMSQSRQQRRQDIISLLKEKFSL
ncbi:MAG: ThiF family adenylyltransferase [Patescibacteria group bacterium]|nr:ThiF family adenylyltransferase [Patescibacteria group bacterium]